MLRLDDYIPIDADKLKKEWDAILNIPNNRWEKHNMDAAIKIINNSKLPHTMRTVKLNMLPALAVLILDGDETGR